MYVSSRAARGATARPDGAPSKSFLRRTCIVAVAAAPYCHSAAGRARACCSLGGTGATAVQHSYHNCYESANERCRRPLAPPCRAPVSARSCSANDSVFTRQHAEVQRPNAVGRNALTSMYTGCNECWCGCSQQNTAGLMAAVSSLPQLTEQKKMVDKHTNIASALLRAIKERGLDQLYQACPGPCPAFLPLRRSPHTHTNLLFPRSQCSFKAQSEQDPLSPGLSVRPRHNLSKLFFRKFSSMF